MPIRVVLDGPRGYAGPRVRHGVSAVVGGLLILIGLTASVLAILSLLLVGVLLVMDDPAATAEVQVALGAEPEQFAVVVVVVTAVSLLAGFLLLRGKRRLVLFLRRFGYGEATYAVTHAAHAIGGSWRVVTLDDADIVPVGVGTGMHRTVRAAGVVGDGLEKARNGVGKVLGFVYGLALVGIVGIAVIVGSRDGSLSALIDSTDSGEAIAVRALLVVALAAVAGVVVAKVLGLLVIPFVGVQMFLGSVSRSVQRAENAKTMRVTGVPDIAVATRSLASQTRRILSPRLVVFRVASRVWRQTVASLASVTAVPLIDVSEPTENLLWEIEALNRAFGPRCVYIGHYERLARLAGPQWAIAAEPTVARLETLLYGRAVLAYTTDQSGMTRFVRALRGALESHSRAPLIARAGGRR